MKPRLPLLTAVTAACGDGLRVVYAVPCEHERRALLTGPCPDCCAPGDLTAVLDVIVEGRARGTAADPSATYAAYRCPRADPGWITQITAFSIADCDCRRTRLRLGTGPTTYTSRRTRR